MLIPVLALATLLATIMFAGEAQSQSNLPKCKGSSSSSWSNCYGQKRYRSGGRYVGEWRNGKFHGQGTYFYSNGDKYVGQWKVSNKNGTGTYTSKSGDKYIGEWLNSKHHGQGTLYTANGSVKYRGQFSNGAFAGSQVANNSSLRKCKGTYWNNCFGTYTSPDGEKYVGEFKYDKFNGQGTHTWPDGAKYVGEFKDGQSHGQGTLTLLDGRKYVGEFKYDKFNGQGTYTWPDGRKYVGDWTDGKQGQGAKFSTWADNSICNFATTLVASVRQYETKAYSLHIAELKRRGLSLLDCSRLLGDKRAAEEVAEAARLAQQIAAAAKRAQEVAEAAKLAQEAAALDSAKRLASAAQRAQARADAAKASRLAHQEIMADLLVASLQPQVAKVETKIDKQIPSTQDNRRKVALVIGNSEYTDAPYLPNPANDAIDMTGALSRLGFDVTKVGDLGYDAMRRALRTFNRKASGADMAIVFYAGHSIEIDKQNYLLPTDVKLESEKDVSFEAVPLELVLEAVSGAKGLKLVILDACRDNPLENTMERSDATRSISRGLARIEPANATLVAYAAKEGTQAVDGDAGGNSPFTKALLAHIEEPGLEINFLFRKVRDSVMKQTDNRQQPFTYGSLPGRKIYLRKEEKKLQTTKTEADLELELWNVVKNTNDASVLDVYLKKFPNGVFAGLAKKQLVTLKFDTQITQTETSADAELLLKPGRVQSETVTVDEAVPEDPIAAKKLALKVQKELNRVGCSAGRPDGIWGKGSKRAAENFGKYAKLELVSLDPSPKLLELIEEKTSRVCPLDCRNNQDLKNGLCVNKQVVKVPTKTKKATTKAKTTKKKKTARASSCPSSALKASYAIWSGSQSKRSGRQRMIATHPCGKKIICVQEDYINWGRTCYWSR